MAITQVRGGRDPFARTTLMRESFPRRVWGYRCAWCGNQPRVTYAYWHESDGVYSHRARRTTASVFCGIECWRSYSH